MTEKLSNPCVLCVNRDLTQNLPARSIGPIHADEVTMNANARNMPRGLDSCPLRQPDLRFTIYDLRFEGAILATEHTSSRANRKSAIVNPRKEVVAMSREQFLKLTSLSSCAG